MPTRTTLSYASWESRQARSESNPFFPRELGGIAIVANPAETVALPSKRRVLIAEHISVLTSVNVRTEDKRCVTVVGVPINSEEGVIEHAGGQ